MRPVLAAFIAILAVFGSTAPAQTPTPTAEQLEMFRMLTPEQQQAILQRSGGQTGSNQTSGGLDNRSSTAQKDAAAQDALAARLRARQQGEEVEPFIPVFKPEDTVLVQVELPVPKLPQLLPPTGQTQSPIPEQQRSQDSANVQLLQQAEKLVLAPDEKKKLEDLIDLLRSRNPYRLDADAILNLPGFAGIALGGLTEEQATKRLAAEPALYRLDIKLVRLPVAKSGVARLKPFGYDLFDEAPSTFSPVTDVPVPADYTMGPGDELQVQLYGNQNRSLRLVVNRDGRVNLPDIGPVNVAGRSFDAVRQDIEARVSREMIGLRASVAMGDMRSIRVFVLGEAKFPGSYAVSGLATVTSALFASGGVKPIGSLRDIQLKRQGAVVRHLDLYDLLIRGDTSDDAKLQPGDAIFIPPVGPTVTVSGEVKRPAIYELRGETDVAQVLQMAGGLTPEADLRRGSITRMDDQYQRVVVGLNPNSNGIPAGAVRNGDALQVARLRPTLDSGVLVQGFVFRPGPMAWREGLRLSDVLGSVDELRPNADARYVLIRRELPPDRRVAVLSADLTAALANRGSSKDVPLMPRDQITVFDLESGRERVIKPVIDELRLQSGIDRPAELVRIEGSVRVPGEYPLEPGMKVSDLLRAGGNLNAGAFGGEAELARYSVVSGQSRQTDLIRIDLAALRRGEGAADLTLQPYDHVLVKETPDWTDQEVVTLEGEVRFPGKYPVRRGETLHELLNRAGGLTSLAFPKGSAFTREELKEREQKQLDLLSDRLQTDLASLSLQAAAANQASASQALAAGQSLLAQLNQTKAVGRLVIDLPGILASEPRSAADVSLRNGDRLLIPTQRQEVTVIGEVQSLTSHFYRKELTRDDYIALSGGLTRKADARKVYVVRTDGSVVSAERSLFRRHYEIALMPGDTIVVPLNTERIPKLPFWQAVTQIIYNLAVSVAAINSF